jgi:transcriptional antiterminator Rof (Rho-off)
MNNQNKTYKPIACSYYDYLLELATFKNMVSIVYLVNSIKIETTAILIDIYTKKGIEYLKTDTNIIIQLDELISVGGKLNTDESCTLK